MKAHVSGFFSEDRIHLEDVVSRPNGVSRASQLGLKDAFTRVDEADDAEFYGRDRLVSHLDQRALATVEQVISQLLIEENSIILDLMASWDSHLPTDLQPGKVIGLGLNENELAQNPDLDEWVIHDLNRDPKLPFESATFDVVLNVVSVDYMTRPVEVFQEVNRVLKRGGLFLVIFSNRMFPQKAVKVWKEATEAERIRLVEYFFERAGGFEGPQRFSSVGLPRPKDDKYAHTGLPSDPIYAVYAEKEAGEEVRSTRPKPVIDAGEYEWDRRVVMLRKAEIRTTLRCPYCGEHMKKWAVPQTPFTQWDNEFMYICFSDACPYLVRGWKTMQEQGNFGISYRCMYNPETDTCSPVPIPNLNALRESIIKADDEARRD